MAAKIFISYRRADSGGTAGRVRDRLVRDFGQQNVFMDVDSIPGGVDFAADLSRQVAECRVFLAVIGPNWLVEKDETGARRLDNPDDLLSKEIAAALARDPSVISVIPVLIDDARMPKPDQLPDPIKPLARRNAVEVRNTQFARDADALAATVRDALGKERTWVDWRRVAAVVGASAALVLVSLVVYFWKSASRPPAVESSIASTSRAPAVESSVTNRRAPTIEGGERSSISDWPWLVSVFLRGHFVCNGSLIAAKKVLTTADCVRAGQPINYEAVAAVDDGKDLKVGKRVRVAKINMHPGYSEDQQSSGDIEKNDIAILELAAEFSPPFATISTRRASDPGPGSYALVGVSDFRSVPGNLLQAFVPILNEADCFDGKICAGVEHGAGRVCAATGSAGAPLAINDSVGLKYQIGILSSGPNCIESDEGTGIYTRISSYAGWIKQIAPDVLSGP
jgi:Trypsin/TIR domain